MPGPLRARVSWWLVKVYLDPMTEHLLFTLGGALTPLVLVLAISGVLVHLGKRGVPAYPARQNGRDAYARRGTKKGRRSGA